LAHEGGGKISNAMRSIFRMQPLAMAGNRARPHSKLGGRLVDRVAEQ
jgi:hypothetical protein